MSYVFNSKDAIDFDNWYLNSKNRAIINRENQLMFDMIQPVRGEHVLGIGCATGQRLFKFLERGLTVTGIDASDAMIDAAENNLGNRVDLHVGPPENLPFDDNSFNISIMINALEFSDNFKLVLEEAARVSKDRMFIGLWNKYSIMDVWIQIQEMFPNIPQDAVQLYTNREIKKHLKQILGKIPIESKTTGQPGEGKGNMIGKMIEQFSLLQRCPFGTFLGINATLVPSFRLRPMNLKVEKSNEALAGAV